jgi:CRISPR-associated endonuclease Cas1
MPAKPKSPQGRIETVVGYGVKIFVERGHLVVEDGIADERRRRRFHRATGQLKRLVVIGHTGFITLDALRWISDVGAAFVQIDGDSNLIASTVDQWTSTERRLRRAQVLAAESEQGIRLLRELLKVKLQRQAQVVERLIPYRPEKRGRDRRTADVQGAILSQISEIRSAGTMGELRLAESIAGRLYWQAFANLPIRFESRWRSSVPDHWHAAGPRTSRTDRKRAKRALTPAHAMLNYLYAMLETEATIAAHRMSFDPTLGLMHADKRYRPSLSSDLMEPARPAADAIVLDLLEGRELCRGEVVETRQGVCRLGPSLARELAQHAMPLRDAVSPHAEWLARALLRAPDHPTPLTRQRHRATRRGGAAQRIR